MEKDVLVVIGVGGMGRAIARRLGTGRRVLLADVSSTALESTTALLQDEGHDVAAQTVDVSSRSSVAAVARTAAELGRVAMVAHTAGLSPTQATADAIFHVDLLGVALVVEELGSVIAAGGAGVVIASMAGHLAAVATPDQEQLLASAPTDELLDLPFVHTVTDPGLAYALAKRANHLRVQAASVSWGARSARLNSISPGVISTSMGQQELAGESGAFMRAMIGASGTGRIGTPDDIAAACAFLMGPDASFVTGTDLLVDGGVVASVRSGPSIPHVPPE